MKIPRIMIAAPKSGSGKTMITCALLQALKEKGYPVFSYKCGPDYIDPMFHEKVIQVPAKNLDTFFTGEEQTKRLFIKSILNKCYCREEREAGIAVLEGVMGLFDGLGGVREEGSSYHLAKVTQTPILLVTDAKGMGRSVIPLLAGFLAYDKERLIQGVLLNRISKGYYDIIKPFIEKEFNVPVVGYLPEDPKLHIGSRHLGLVLPDEWADLKEKLQNLAEGFLQTVSLESVLKIAENAKEYKDGELPQKASMHEEHISRYADTSRMDISISSISSITKIRGKGAPVIAVAKDEAFCFYYADNLLLLEEYGAEIQYFSLLHDEKLPDHCHALLLGGGYPELHAEKLSSNSKMRAAVRQAVELGMPVVAECGGFMYLHSALIDQAGVSHDMTGVIPSVCYHTGKLVRFGYVEMQEKRSGFLQEGGRIKGHEFHYYESSDPGDDVIAIKPATGRSYPCVIKRENMWIGFPHLYYPSNPVFAERFVAKASEYSGAVSK